MLKEFKEFAMRGNVLDMAVGIIIGAAFGTIVNSFVNDVIMPPIGLALGGVDFTNMFVVLRDGAKAAGPVCLARRRQGRRRRHAELRRVRQLDRQLPHRRVRGLHGREGRQLAEAEAGRGRAAPPAPTPDQVLLTEIRDLLKSAERVGGSAVAEPASRARATWPSAHTCLRQRVDVQRVVAPIRLDAGLVHQRRR